MTMKDFLDMIFSRPYIYMSFFIFLLIVIAIVLAMVFHKRLSSFLQRIFSKNNNGFKIYSIKTKGIEAKSEDTAPDNKQDVVFKTIDMDKSVIKSVEGDVKLEDIKMKNSYIGEIRSK